MAEFKPGDIVGYDSRWGQGETIRACVVTRVVGGKVWGYWYAHDWVGEYWHSMSDMRKLTPQEAEPYLLSYMKYLTAGGSNGTVGTTN